MKLIAIIGSVSSKVLNISIIFAPQAFCGLLTCACECFFLCDCKDSLFAWFLLFYVIKNIKKNTPLLYFSCMIVFCNANLTTFFN